MQKIKIVNAGHNKLNVVKEVKNLTGLGLKESKDIVNIEGIFEISDEHDTESVINAFLEIGAIVEKSI